VARAALVTTRRGLAIGALLAAAAGVAALVLLNRAAPPAPEPMPRFAEGMAVRGTLAPRSYLFGDQLRARLEILIDRNVFDPAKVDVDARFTPFAVVGEPERERRDFADLTRIRYLFVLECLTIECVPESIERPIQFPQAVVNHDDVAIEQFSWPGFPILARVRETSISAIPGSDWRASAVVRAADYRLSPTLFVALLGLGGTACLAMSVLLAATASAGLSRRWRRLRLTPLERALAALERANAVGVEHEQRLALDRLADELRTRGAGDLALTARRLAWAEDVPQADRTAPLSAGVRELLQESTNGRRDGRP
jgi:hypothetical protein